MPDLSLLRYIAHNHMPTYYVNKLDQGEGTHIVHSEGCVFLPVSKSLTIPLGTHNTCTDAVVAAKDFYENVRGCFVCYQNDTVKYAQPKFELHESKRQ